MLSDREAHSTAGDPLSRGRGAIRLVVFSDDYGRHPSSCQHLVRALLDTNCGSCGSGVCGTCCVYRVLWVNTIGTRRPGLSFADLSRAAGKLRGWAGGPSWRTVDASGLPDDLTAIDPKMWPGFRRPAQRWFNARSITRAVHGALGPRVEGERRIAITTLPITADLVGRLDVDRWVYYCVDDFSAWPGLDSGVMQVMERELVGSVDDVVAVSGTLQERIVVMGRSAGLLTHGIDTDHWADGADRSGVGDSMNNSYQGSGGGALSRKRLVRGEGVGKPAWWPDVSGPVALFWGLIDRRLDVQWCRALSEGLGRQGGCLILAGPEQNADPVIHGLPDTVLPGAVSYESLPALAGAADVLVMPYADAPVTRAMQPLKFKEYLATGKPVVVRDLPAMEGWVGCCDVVADGDDFARVCLARAYAGLPLEQRRARERRMVGESWSEKARQMAGLWLGPANPPMKSAA